MSSTHFMARSLLLIVLFGVPNLAHAQNLRLIDSLKSKLRGNSAGEFEILNNIGFEYRYSYPDSTILYCTRAYEIGKSKNLRKALAKPLSFIGLAKANQGDYAQALDYQNRAAEVALQQQDTFQLAHGYNNVGRIFFDQGDLVRAYSNFVKARDLFEKIDDKSGLAYTHRSLAGVFKSKKDLVKALEHSQKALALRRELGDQRAIASALMELGLVYEEMDSTALALTLFQKTDSIATAIDDRVTKAEIKIGMAEIFCMEGKSNEASALARDVVKIVSETTNQKIFLRARLLMAKCMIESKKTPDLAIPILLQVYESSAKSGNLVFQREAARLLAKVYAELDQLLKAKDFNNVYVILDRTIENADLSKEIERLQFQLLVEKTEKENQALKAQQVQDEALITRQRSQNLLLAIIALFVAVFAVLAWRLSQRRKIINQKLEDQNIHILAQREEIAKQNEILSRSNHELDGLNHEKDTLMNIVAHDLKSPLNRIYGLVKILESEVDLNEEQKAYLRLMKESTLGGLDLITDLLDVHAWKELRENPKPQAFSLHDFLEKKIHAFEHSAQEKGITIKWSARERENADRKIVSEPNYLGRIFDNLLSNAIKFSSSRSTVEVTGLWKDGLLMLTIKDQGPGFTKEDQTQMFQKFRKLSARPTAGESSNGLGLAIVRILVDRLGGTIDLKTAQGQGSEFIISIPAEIFQTVAI
jgi:signal transduction histidine kinase/tetratricopeptide (TPR) repeat protein